MDMELESFKWNWASGGFYLVSFCRIRKDGFDVRQGLLASPEGFWGAIRNLIWLAKVQDLAACNAVVAELLGPILYHQVLTSIVLDIGDSVRKETWISG